MTGPKSSNARRRSKLLYLRVLQLDRRGSAEDRNRDLESGPLLIDLLDVAVEGGEGTVGNPDLLADLES